MVMNRDLYNLEERIKNFFEKERNSGKSFSLLFIANLVDPSNKYDYNCFETVLKKLELDGFLYHYPRRDTWRLFPFEHGLIQATVRKNQKGSCLIDLEDGKKYIIKPEDAGYLLDGDIISFKPSEKKSGSRSIAEVDKIIKRKNGLVVAEFSWLFNGYDLRFISSNITYPVSLPDDVIDSLNTGDRLLLKIGDINYAGVLETDIVCIMSKDIDDEAIMNSFSDPDIPLFGDDEVIDGDDFSFIKKQPDDELSKEDREILSEETYDDFALETYVKNIDRIKLEHQLCDYTIQGVLRINRYGEGIVEYDGKRYCVRKENLNDALDGDKVEIRPTKLRARGKLISVVESVIERNNAVVVAEVDHIETDENGKTNIVLVPINADIKHKIVLPESFNKPLVVGDRLALALPKEPEKGCYVARFIRAVGHKDDPDADLKLVAAEYDIEEEFTPEQMAEAEAIPQEVQEKDKVGRLDFTKKRVFTIDGANAKDKDDALSIETLENGNYLVGVHIADVTHYIKPGTALWDAILQRGTSVYMADSVIPMLPHILSNGILSLNPKVERLAFSCIIEMSPNGDVVNFDFEETVIKSEKAMVYDEVNEILEDGYVPEGYEEYTEDLNLLNNLSNKLSQKRESRGAIDFNDIESDTETEKDENGKIIAFVPKRQRSAERLIENFMLLAGTCYAEYMMTPTTLRIHEAPDLEAVEEGIDKLKKIGVKVTQVRDILNPASLSRVIKSIKDEDVRSVAARIILCSMKRARIDVDEYLGHYALALRKIGRFTSPMRRAEDAIGHWQLKKQKYGWYDNEKFDEEVARDYEWIKDESEHINIKQYNADGAEKAGLHVKMVRFIEEHMDETFPAKVDYINEYGIWIKTGNGVIGKIDPEDVDGDYFIYDDNNMTYRGRFTGKTIHIGMKLRVIPLDTQREHGVINFGTSMEYGKILSKKRVA